MKKAILISIISIFSLSICSCGSSKKEMLTDSTGKIQYEKCTISFDWWGGDSRHEATQNAVKAFEEKYPGITVEVKYGAWDGWETAKAAEYISNTNPDLQQTNFDWIEKYDPYGSMYLDLNTVSDVLDLNQYSESILNTVKDDNGGIAGIPVSVTGRTFYWNKKVFAEAGLETPTTLDELLNAGKVFKDKLGDNYYPLAMGPYDRAILMTYYLQGKSGVSLITEDDKLSVTKDELKEGIEFICSLEDAHVIPTLSYMDGEGAESIDKSERFINGEYAGIFEWDSSPGKYVSALGENGSNLIVGNVFSELHSYSKVSLMFSISAKSKHPHEAAMLLNYLMNDPDGVMIMGVERGIPESEIAYQTLIDNDALSEISADAHESVMDSDPLYWNPLFDDSVLKGDTAAYTIIFNQLSYKKDSAGADYTVDNATDDLYEAYETVLNNAQS